MCATFFQHMQRINPGVDFELLSHYRMQEKLLSLQELGITLGYLRATQTLTRPDPYPWPRVWVFMGQDRGFLGSCRSLRVTIPLVGSTKNCLDTVVNYLINFIPLYVKLKLIVIMQLWKNNNLGFHI